MPLKVTLFQAEGRVPVTVLSPHGQVDASNYQDLIAEAERAYAAGTRDILLDLGDVSYMSSSGLVALQSIAALLRGEDIPTMEAGWEAFQGPRRDKESGVQCHLKLLAPQPRVERVLDVVGLTRYLETYTDREAAIASF